MAPPFSFFHGLIAQVGVIAMFSLLFGAASVGLLFSGGPRTCLRPRASCVGPIMQMGPGGESWSPNDENMLRNHIANTGSSVARSGACDIVMQGLNSAFVLIFNAGQQDEGVYTLQGRQVGVCTLGHALAPSREPCLVGWSGVGSGGPRPAGRPGFARPMSRLPAPRRTARRRPVSPSLSTLRLLRLFSLACVSDPLVLLTPLAPFRAALLCPSGTGVLVRPRL